MNSKTKTQFIEYFIKGIKKPEQLKIGVEHERFLFEGKNKKRITYKKLKQLFENLKKKGWVSILEKKNLHTSAKRLYSCPATEHLKNKN